MRCPRCGNRAMSVPEWYGHSLWQPAWKQQRWVTHCRSCKAMLDPSSRDRALRLALPVSAMFVSFAVAAQLPVANRPYGFVHAVIGALVGIFAHYWLASYDCLDDVPLPTAKTESNR